VDYTIQQKLESINYYRKAFMISKMVFIENNHITELSETTYINLVRDEE
jgi:hypothetical protein